MKKSFITIFKESYEKSKKLIAYLLVLALIVFQIIIDSSILSDEMNDNIKLALLLFLIGIIMETMFNIHEKISSKKSYLKQISPNQLYEEILNIVKSNKNINIKHIGVAGRYGWFTVIKRLLDSNNDDSLHETNKFNIEIALMSLNFLEENKDIFSKYKSLGAIIDDIKSNQQYLDEEYANKNKQINLYVYDYMPNFVGFLVNDSYLFSNVCFWEETNNQKLDFRGGGTDYLMYDLNDEVGGAEYIKRFNGWFDFIKQNNNSIDVTSSEIVEYLTYWLHTWRCGAKYNKVLTVVITKNKLLSVVKILLYMRFHLKKWRRIKFILRKYYG